ncbi:phosphoglycerate kinase [Pelagibacteraceae bacterium]|nr:phosphoglycerate kinase [Pelagibacteraceae bacterium]
MKKLNNNEIKNKKIIFRADLNIPVFKKKITDYSRLDAIIPSLTKLIQGKNKIFIIAHYGRPKGKVDNNLSINFLCEQISQKLKVSKVHFLKSINHEEIKKKLLEMNEGEVCLLENIRFFKEEENNDFNFSKSLSSNFDIYVNDAFSVSHRNHSSIVGLPKFLPSYAGLSFTKEIENLNNFLIKAKKPNLAIIGGSKISTKIQVINNLITLFDTVVIGGAMANTFLLAKKYNIGTSICEKDFISIANEILINAKNKNCKIILPVDVVCSKNLQENPKVFKCDINSVPNDQMVLDIGDKSINLIFDEIIKCRSVLWNGPLGAFEYNPFNKSSIDIANQIKKKFKEKTLNALAGGGDTISVINLAKTKDGFNYLSNAGGAFLEWLEGNKSPGYISLETNQF